MSKVGDKDGKVLYKLMNNTVYEKKGKIKKQNRYETCKQLKRLLKMGIQTKLYLTQNI